MLQPAVKNVSRIIEGEAILATETAAWFTPSALLEANSQYFFVSVLLYSVIMFLPFLEYAVMKKQNEEEKLNSLPM